jgi:hypothetical protein
VIPHTLNKIPAMIDAAIQATIYTGPLDERQLQVTHRRFPQFNVRARIRLTLPLCRTPSGP